MRKGFAIVLLLLSFVAIPGCKTPIKDLSINAAEAGDFTIASACEALPGRGADICRVKAGSPVDGAWTLILPAKGRVISGELVIDYRDVTRSYAITDSVVRIPFRDVINHSAWAKDDTGVILARAKIRYKGKETEEVWRARGFANIVVTEASYDPLPMDSGLGAFSTTCTIDYTTAGRSSIKCR